MLWPRPISEDLPAAPRRDRDIGQQPAGQAPGRHRDDLILKRQPVDVLEVVILDAEDLPTPCVPPGSDVGLRVSERQGQGALELDEPISAD